MKKRVIKVMQENTKQVEEEKIKKKAYSIFLSFFLTIAIGIATVLTPFLTNSFMPILVLLWSLSASASHSFSELDLRFKASILGED